MYTKVKPYRFRIILAFLQSKFKQSEDSTVAQLQYMIYLDHTVTSVLQ